MEGPVSFWGYKEQESNLILPEHDDDDDDDDEETKKLSKEAEEDCTVGSFVRLFSTPNNIIQLRRMRYVGNGARVGRRDIKKR